MPKLYHMQDSGNCYKIRLLLAQTEQACELVPVDILKGESRSPAFLARNPNGRIPTLELDDGKFLAESNAILWYLAQATAYWPEAQYEQALVLQWFGFEQYSHEPFIATSRYWIKILAQPENYQRQLAEKRAGGWAALKVMEQHLARQDFFVGNYSLADIALFAYTHVSDEGGFPLDDYPAIRAWIERVKNTDRFITMDQQ